MNIKVRVELKWQDAWIGAFWKRTTPVWICDEDQDTDTIWKPRTAEVLHVWVCIVPCLPIHFMAKWNERVMTEEETIADMMQLD